MEKRKVFIIFTYLITVVGGTQMYVAGKAKYLENLGWTVYLCASGPDSGSAKIPSLTKYISTGSGFDFIDTPAYKYRRYEQEQILNFMLHKLNLSDYNNCEIIIETHNATRAIWGELFAAKIGARHIFCAVNEIYRTPESFYEDNLDFFYFKWKRNELACNEKSCTALFNGYKNITAPSYEMPNIIQEMYPIQDVDFPVENVQRLDWNICHVGRAEKDYVPYVIEGVAKLARHYPDKKINFIFVGNADIQMPMIQKNFQNLSNVRFTFLGDMVPIPRILFSKVDVACAISQSARFVANEGVLTVCGSAKNYALTPGVLGYDTKEQIFAEVTFSYFEALENVLVKKLYEGKEYSLPKLEPEEKSYENFWTIVKNADPKKEYYVARLSQERIRNWTAIFPFSSIARGARIILFGATEIAKDYRRQIISQRNSTLEFGKNYIKQFKSQPYCEIITTVDEHPEEFDNSVVDIERLKDRDYDVILICAYPQNAQAAYNKIVQTVPDMANRVIYDFQKLPV